jgi:hypothetical protein
LIENTAESEADIDMESPVIISDHSENESGPIKFPSNRQRSSMELQERRSVEPSSNYRLVHDIFSSDEADDHFKVVRSAQEFFTYMETSPLPVKGCKI